MMNVERAGVSLKYVASIPSALSRLFCMASCFSYEIYKLL